LRIPARTTNALLFGYKKWLALARHTFARMCNAFYVVGNIDFWEFIHRKVEVSARTKGICLRLATCSLQSKEQKFNSFKF